MTHEPSDAETTINGIVDRLALRFPAQSATTIRDVVTHAYEELNGASGDFVEVLVEKQAKKQLKHMEDEHSTTAPAPMKEPASLLSTRSVLSTLWSTSTGTVA